MQRTLIMTLLVLSYPLAGCASQSSDDAGMRKALQEKDAAYVRLAKAITSYCSMVTDTIDAKQACIFERRLAAEGLDARETLQAVPPVSHLRSSR